MKLNRYLLLATLLLLGVGLILGGCAKKDNPFSPNVNNATGVSEGDLINAGGVGISLTGGAAMPDLKPDSTGTQGEIIITFPVYMNAGTVNLTNISIDGMTPGTGVISYYPESKKAVIQGSWQNGDYWCKIVLKTGLLSAAGKPIDGNGNGKQDGSPYDDLRNYFRIGLGGPATAIDFTNPKLMASWPNSFNIAPIYPQFAWGFDANDIDSNVVRNASVTLKDTTGKIYTLKSDGTGFGVGGYWWVMWRTTLADSILPPDMKFTWSINLNQVADTHSNKAIWQNYGYIANLPIVNVIYRTHSTTGGTYWVPLHYSSRTVSGNELIVAFDDSLNYSTVNSTTVKVFRGSAPNYTGQVYGRVYWLPEDVAAHQLRFSLENTVVGNTYTLWLSRAIKDNEGLYLDGNNNNIGGEAGDPTFNGSNFGWTTYLSDDYHTTFTP